MFQIFLRVLCVLCTGFALHAESRYPATRDSNSAVSSACQPASANDVLRCVVEHHPDLVSARAELKRLAAEVRKAGQGPNPGVESRVLGSGDSLSAGVDFQHTFETGGKRDARVDVAEQNLALARSRVDVQKQSLVIQAAVHLLRLRQMNNEIEQVEETTRTYERIIRRMRARPGLNSEQNVNLSTYEIAAAETRIQSVGLSSERTRVMANLSFASGAAARQLESIQQQLADFRWPDAGTTPAFEKSEELNVARRRIARARAKLDLENANAYPDLSFGPAFEYRQSRQSSGGIFGGSSRQSDAEVGLSFQFTLPLYHTNDGARDAAQAEVAAETTREHSVLALLASEREQLEREYRAAVAGLRDGLSQKFLETRRALLAAAIDQGRVSPPAVIEFHRSLFEYTSGRNALEIQALRTLLGIYGLDGQILDKVEQNEIF